MPSTGHTSLALKVGEWQVLPLPRDNDADMIEVGVLELHPNPSLNRVVYTTCGRCCKNQGTNNGINKAKIVIHDFNYNYSNGGSGGDDDIVAMFTLRELAKQINEFRNELRSSEQAEYNTHSHDLIESLSTILSPPTMRYTVQMLGAVQHLSFLSHDALKCVLPSKYVKEDTDINSSHNRQRLMIGFRQCTVIVSIRRLLQKNERILCCVPQIIAFIGPNDLDEYYASNNVHARKRQPSSFPIPITESIIAYGCYDGGIRFYDFIRRKQVKAALGPNGRENPIVRVINASTTDNALPRIISVCATGIAYLWVLDLSIDLDTGEVLNFDIPPPLVSFNGLVAAVSGKGVPIKHPPPLSPKSVASLSSCSSWIQTDEVNSQFEVSFDPYRKLLHWVFSPDCLGSTTSTRLSREERLDMNGALVCWDMADLPMAAEWPPSALPPKCVVELPRTDCGRISSEMVVANIPDVLPNGNSRLVTIYITSSNELISAVTDLHQQGRCSVQFESSIQHIIDLNPSKCITISSSRAHPSLIAIGSQHGVMLTNISHDSSVMKQQQLFPIEETESQTSIHSNSNSSASGPKKNRVVILSQQQHLLLTSRIRQLENQNNELECKLNDMQWESNEEIDSLKRQLARMRVQLTNALNENCTHMYAEI